MTNRVYRGFAYAIACQLKKPQMQKAVVAVFNATLDKLVEGAIFKLQELEKKIRDHDEDIIDAEYEIRDEFFKEIN